LLCDFAVVHLTARNPSVLCQLGMRQSVRPGTTLAIFAANQAPRFDSSCLPTLRYELGPNNCFTSREADLLRRSLEARLLELGKPAVEMGADSSPLQLLNGFPSPDIARLKTDVFRDRARYSSASKHALAIARERGSVDEVENIEKNLGPFSAVEAGVLVDILLSYRALGAWQSMLHLCPRLPASLQRTVMVREQYGLALNRVGRWQEAVEVLERVITEHGPSSETLSILGRIYKDLWRNAEKLRNESLANSYLRRAIDSYVRGFEADWRDAYPGINALVLLFIEGGAEAERHQAELLPVVTFAVKQRLKSGKPDYWDYATLLELAVLESDEVEARRLLAPAVAHIREQWEPNSTARNLGLIQEARKRRGLNQLWLDEVIFFLRSQSGSRHSS
jgi:tetratricopeptide (TPR) repeat protein